MNTTTKKSVIKQYLFIGVAIAIYFLTIRLPLPESFLSANDVTLSLDGRISLGVLFFCLFLWITEPIPFHITGVLGVVLMTFTRVVNISTGAVAGFNDIVRLGFGDGIIVFFIGILTLSAIVTKSGLGKRITMFILTITGNKTPNVLLGFMITGCVLSFFLTDMAVAAILMPIVRSMCEEEKLVPLKSNFAKALMITCSWAAIIGGIATPSAGGSNVFAFNAIRNPDLLGYDLTFLGWMMYGVPASLLMMIPAWLLLLKMFKPEIKQLSRTKEQLKMDFKALGKMSRDEKVTAAVFLFTVTLWLTADYISPVIGVNIVPALPAFLCCALFFLPGMISFKWKEVSNDIAWEGVILIATGISVGMTMFHTGAAHWMAEKFLGGLLDLHPIFQIFLVVTIVQLIKVVLSSNTVTATIIIPVMIVMVQARPLIPHMGIGIILPTAISLSLAFILVTSTPTNVIPYSTGYFTMSDFAKAGMVMTIISSLILAASMFVIGYTTGLY